MHLIAMRYFLIRDPNSLLSSDRITHNDKILSVFFDRTTVDHYGKSYYAIISNNETDDILVGFLLRSKTTEVIIPDQNEFEKQNIPNWEKALLAIDTVNQTILVQIIAGSFTPDLVKNVMNKLLDVKSIMYDVSAKVEFICRHDSFWTTYNNATKRYRISISLNAPNLFGAENETDAYLREVRKKTNMDKITEAIESKDGKIKVEEGYLDSLVDYADKGGGHWSQVTEENGVRKTTTSNSAVVKEEANIVIDTPKDLKEKYEHVRYVVAGIFNRHIVNRRDKD